MDEKENILIFASGVVLFFVLVVVSHLLMPENCYLIETRNIGLLCDGLDLHNPQPCPTCANESAATASRIVFGLGVGSLILPGVIHFIRHRRN